MAYKIAVFGSAAGCNEEINNIVFELGKTIAKNNCILITGGCGGIPQIAAKGAVSIGGKTIAFSPGRCKEEHINKHRFPTEGYSDFEFVPENYPYADNVFAARKYRNVSSCFYCDAGIIVSGRIGTLNEFTILYDIGKTIGVLRGTGGITSLLPEVIKTSNKKTDAEIIYDSNPKYLIEKIIKELEKK